MIERIEESIKGNNFEN